MFSLLDEVWPVVVYLVRNIGIFQGLIARRCCRVRLPDFCTGLGNVAFLTLDAMKPEIVKFLNADLGQRRRSKKKATAKPLK